MVLLGVDCEDDLYWWGDRCFYDGIPYMTFIEPDIGDQMTAIAFCPGDKLSKELRSRKLLDFRQRDVSSAHELCSRSTGCQSPEVQDAPVPKIIGEAYS